MVHPIELRMHCRNYTLSFPRLGNVTLHWLIRVATTWNCWISPTGSSLNSWSINCISPCTYCSQWQLPGTSQCINCKSPFTDFHHMQPTKMPIVRPVTHRDAPASLSATTLVSVWNTRVFQTALTVLNEPRTLWQRITRYAVTHVTGHAAYVPRLHCGNVYVSSERHMCYTLCRGCSDAEAVYTTAGDVYAFLRPSDTLYLSTIAIYWMLHCLQICLVLRCCHLLQISLRFRYIAYHCICFAIIVFYRYEI